MSFNAGFANYPNGFKNGVMVRGLPVTLTHPGKVFWVGNPSTLQLGEKNKVDAIGRGTFLEPFSTIDYAIGQCLANRGDLILVKPGYTQTLTNATDLVLDVAGVAIIGLGVGSNRPTITFSTNATANIPVTAANVSVQNILFVANKADVASVFTATGTSTPTDFAVEGCEFRDTSSILNFLTIVTGNATANSMDGLYFSRNRVSSLGTTAATTAIKILSATKRMRILDNFGASAVLNDTPAVLDASTFQMTDFELARNIWERPNTSSTGGSFVAGSGNAWTGMAYDNYFYQVDNTAGIWISTGHGAAFGYQNNYSPITGATDKSGLINPAAV